MGKGSGRRPRTISQAEEALRWKLYFGDITHNQFIRRYAKLSQKDLLRKF